MLHAGQFLNNGGGRTLGSLQTSSSVVVVVVFDVELKYSCSFMQASYFNTRIQRRMIQGSWLLCFTQRNKGRVHFVLLLEAKKTFCHNKDVPVFELKAFTVFGLCKHFFLLASSAFQNFVATRLLTTPQARFWPRPLRSTLFCPLPNVSEVQQKHQF